MKSGPRKRIAGLAVLAVAATLSLAACSSSSSSGSKVKSSGSSSAGQKEQGGVATFSFDAGGGANYILPIIPGNLESEANTADFQYLMYRPLYWFGVGSDPTINTSLSLANLPVFTNGGKTVTITLKPYVWSDGTPVSARDIEFWQNLIDANPEASGTSIPGGYPSNIVKTTVVNSSTIQFTMNKAYNTSWLLYNELSDITPLPQQAWDKTSATSTDGNYDTTKAGALSVLNYLTSQAKQISSYATNPLWQTVDGPWKLTAFDSSSDSTMVPNPKYSGPVKPTLSEFKEVSYTDTSAEFNALAAGTGADVGFISPVEQASQGLLTHLGYVESPQIFLEIEYDIYNFNNPTVGPMLKQLYIRQAMQELVDENGMIKNYESGDGYVTCGPIPSQPSNSFLDSYEASCPFSYNPAKAAATLAAHGWNVVKGGVDTCKSPGTGPTQCGAGITAGEKLEFTYIYDGEVGIAYPKERIQIGSDFALGGIKLNLKSVNETELQSETVPCTSSQADCSWEISGEGGWIYSPDYYPSGEDLFETGAGSNLGSYSDPETDKLIAATNLNSSEAPQQALDAYENYLTQQSPVLWEQVGYVPSEVKSNLHGVTPLNPYDNINPENWYYTK
jgi:peptide/nickel transport system substrate-binding protein